MQKQTVLSIIIIGLIGLSIGLICAEEKLSPEQTKKLIEQLAADDFQKREDATVQLMKIGEPVMETLRNALKESKDPEVRLRLNQIITDIEGALAVKDLVKNWSTPDGKPLWYQLKIAMAGMSCYIRSSTIEDKYKEEKVLKMQDVVTMTTRGKLGVINMTSFCRKDKNLTPLYAIIEMADGQGNINSTMEYKFENGKVTLSLKDSNGMKNDKVKEQAIPPDTFLINSFVRYLTLLPLKEKLSVQLNLLGPDMHEFLMKINVTCEGKNEIIIGKDKISAYKFKFFPEKHPNEAPSLWITEKHQLVKLAPSDNIAESGELILISQEEAEKGMAELMKKGQKEEDNEKNR